MPENVPRPSPHRLGPLLLTGAVLSIPVVCAAALMAMVGTVTAQVAAGFVLLSMAGIAWIAWLHVTDMRLVERYLRDLIRQADYQDRQGDAGEVPAPAPWGLVRIAGLCRQLAGVYRRQVQGAAGERDELLDLAQTIADPLILIGADRRVRLENRAARHYFEFSLIQHDLADGLRNPDVLAATDAVLAGGAAQTIVLDTAGAADPVYEVRIAPFPPSRMAKARGALLSLHDITAIMRSERMRADFVANASHEMRNPLSILSGCIETLQGAAKGDAVASERFLTMMAAQAERMSRLTNDLLSLSLIEMDELVPPSGEVALRRVILMVADALKIKAKDRGVTLKVDCPDLPTLIGDSDQIEQVLTNLIDNGIKYGAENSEVTVIVRLKDRDEQIKGRVVCISVQDRGEGIARAHLPRLTERFYRVDAARSRALGGTGLGLAIVKHIVARHQGRLAVHSSQDGDPGETGSTFSAILPVDMREI